MASKVQLQVPEIRFTQAVRMFGLNGENIDGIFGLGSPKLAEMVEPPLNVAIRLGLLKEPIFTVLLDTDGDNNVARLWVMCRLRSLGIIISGNSTWKTCW